MKIKKDVLVEILKETLVKNKGMIKKMIKDSLLELFSEDFVRRTVMSEMKKYVKPKIREQVYEGEDLEDSVYDDNEEESEEENEDQRIAELKKNINFGTKRKRDKQKELTPKQMVAMNTVVNDKRGQIAEKLGIKDNKIAEAINDTQNSDQRIEDDFHGSDNHESAYNSYVESELAAAQQRIPDELKDEETGGGVDLTKFALISNSSGKWGEIAETLERGK